MKVFLIFFYSFSVFAEPCVQPVNDLLKPKCSEALASRIEEVCTGQNEIEYARRDDIFNSLADDFLNVNKVLLPSHTSLFASSPNQEILKLEELRNCQDRFCIGSWQLNTTRSLFDKIKETEAWNSAFNRISKSYHALLDQYQSSLENEWSFELDFANQSPMNSVLERLKSTPLSDGSGEGLSESLTTLHEYGPQTLSVEETVGIGPNHLQAVFNTGGEVTKFLGIFTISHRYDQKIELSHQIVLNDLDPANHLFTDFAMAHEIAHSYTEMVKGEMRKFSRKTRRDLEERLATCLYGEEAVDFEIGEDLADILASEMLKARYPNPAPEHYEGLIKNFCHLNQIGYVHGRSPHGHSPAFDRLQNLLKYNKDFQDYLGCHEDRTVCTINMGN